MWRVPSNGYAIFRPRVEGQGGGSSVPAGGSTSRRRDRVHQGRIRMGTQTLELDSMQTLPHNDHFYSPVIDSSSYVVPKLAKYGESTNFGELNLIRAS